MERSKKDIRCLSIFDGIGGARVALEKAGFNVTAYHRAEIDEIANSTYYYNYPYTTEMYESGNFKIFFDVRKLDGTKLRGKVDLLIGGPPCQPFSRSGEGAGFDDSRGKLMFEAARLIKEVQPKYFLIENVVMKREWMEDLDLLFGVKAQLIDSSLFSAQKRRRLYWTNLRVKCPSTMSPLVIRDILHEPDDDWCGQVIDGKKAAISGGNRQQRQVDHGNGKARTLTANSRAGGQLKVTLDGKTWRALSAMELERLQGFPDEYTKLRHDVYKIQNDYVDDGAPGFFPSESKLTSKTARIKLLGQAFQCDTIAHILSGMEV